MVDSRDSGLVVYALDKEGGFVSRLGGLFTGLFEKVKALLVLFLWFALWGALCFATFYGLNHLLQAELSKTDGSAANTRWFFCLLTTFTIPLWLALSIRLLKSLLPTLHKTMLPSGLYGGGQFLKNLQTAVQTNAENGEVPLAHFFIDDLFAEVDFGMSNFVFALVILMLVAGYGFALYLEPFEPVALSLFIGISIFSMAILLWLTELAGNIDGLTAALCHGLLIAFATFLWYRFPSFVKPLLLGLLPVLVFETFLLFKRIAQLCKRRLLVLTTRGMRFIPLKLSFFPYPHLTAASTGEVMPIASITARPGPWGERWRMNFTFGAFEEICPVFVRARMIAQIAGAAGMEIKVQEMRSTDSVKRGYLGYALCALWSLWFIAICGPSSHFFVTFHQDFEHRQEQLFKEPQALEAPLLRATQHHPFSLLLHSSLAHSYLNQGNKKMAFNALSPIRSLFSFLPNVLTKYPEHKVWRHYDKIASYLALHGRDQSVAASGWEPKGKATSHFRRSLALLLSTKLTRDKFKKGYSLLVKSQKLAPQSPGPRFLRAIIMQLQLFAEADSSSVAEVLIHTEGTYEQARRLLAPLLKDEKWKLAAMEIGKMTPIPPFELLYFALLREFLDEGKLSSKKKVVDVAAKRSNEQAISLASLRSLAVAPPNNGEEILSLLTKKTNQWPELSSSSSEAKLKLWFAETYRVIGSPKVPVDIKQRANLDPGSAWLKKCFGS